MRRSPRHMAKADPTAASPAVSHSVETNAPATAAASRGTPAEVFAAFLKLGLTSFGGPIAHLGYFRDELVVRRKWISEEAYVDLVALCQFLPGPASSQTGFALGLMRAGPLGAAAAFIGFTLPSAILLVAFALSAAAVDGPIAEAVLHGLKLVAVAVVAQAIWGMAKSLTPDPTRASIAVAAAAVLLSFPLGAFGQVAVILAGCVLGLLLCRVDAPVAQHELAFPLSRRAGVVSLLLFFVLLLGLPLAAQAGWQPLVVFDSFYRAGALVFGGGHVVLPLLEAEVVTPGWTSASSFLAGYGAAQAVPGPLFSFAAYLGAIVPTGLPAVLGALVAVLAIFLPGFLVLVGTLPFWDALRRQPSAQAAMRGANAAVVGLLGAAFYDPVWTSAIVAPRDVALALAGFLLLAVWKVQPWIVVLLVPLATALIAAFGV